MIDCLGFRLYRTGIAPDLAPVRQDPLGLFASVGLCKRRATGK